MRFSYHPSMCNPSFYLELGKAAEAAGFDAITFPDSICYPKECDSTYPYNDDGSREFLDAIEGQSILRNGISHAPSKSR